MYVKIKSRVRAHRQLRGCIPAPPGLTVLVRLGSTSPAKHEYDVVLNRASAIRVSADKLKMKQAFKAAGVRTSEWLADPYQVPNTQWQNVIVKPRFGRKGRGIIVIPRDEFVPEDFDTGGFIFEKYYKYKYEYRIHTSRATKCFLAFRKSLVQDRVNESNKWVRNSTNCVFLKQENPKFFTPSNFEDMVAECQKALIAVGLDIGALDVIYSPTTGDFRILETNSAPGLASLGIEAYKQEISKLINH